ncbi:phosphodiesterase [Labrys neptuniae]
MPMLIAQITDFHILAQGLLGGRIDTRDYARRAIAHVKAMPVQPSLILVTGDLADTGSDEEYRIVRALLDEIEAPVYVIPGNHDRRDRPRQAFGDLAYMPETGFIHYVVDGLPLRLIGLDTLVEGEGHGALCATRLDWLEARLQESKAPAVIFMHHPPGPFGVPALDSIGLREGAERFADLVSRFSNVERILCGHVHRPISFRFAGTMVTTIPSTAHQLALALGPAEDLQVIMEPPAIGLHRWLPGSGLVSHLDFIGPFEGPYSF